ncbi:hypothetical protein EI541_20355 [Xanthomonas citri pv. eucalyptorum]|nr:hypothetical protein EI541_20355 [Xanthomonas axonopodis pv. eucalyptorum]
MPRVSVSVSAAAVISLRHRPPRPLGLKTAYAILDDHPVCSGTLVPNSPRHAHSVQRAACTATIGSATAKNPATPGRDRNCATARAGCAWRSRRRP